MINYGKCKCGYIEAFGSMPPNPCDRCEKCGTGYGYGAPWYKEPIEHEFQLEGVETNEGTKQLSRCIYCRETKGKIEKDLKNLIQK